MKKVSFVLKLLTVAVFAIGTSCQKKNEHASIRGSVLESEELIVYEITPGEVMPLDTLPIKKGAFALERKIEEPTFFLLEFSAGTRIPIIAYPGDKVELDVNDTSLFGIFTAKGNPSVMKMAEQRLLIEHTARLIDSLDEQSYLLQDYPDEFMEKKPEWNRLMDARLLAHRNMLHQIIDRDTTDLSNIMAFYQTVSGIEILTFEEDRDYYEKVSRGLQTRWPENKHVKYYQAQLKRYEEAVAKQEKIEAAAQNIVAGQPVPNIVLPNPDGDTLTLSSLKGKIVLLDFWGSWCAPCRRANPELVRLYNLYNSKGFEIFSVSLDGLDKQPNAINDWRYAIEYDGLMWPYHVSDLKAFNSPLIEEFGIEGIPFAILINRDGDIINRGVNLKELPEILSKLLK